MRYVLKQGGDRTVVAMSGRLTFSDSPIFPKVLEDIASRGGAGCDVDLTDLDAIDSTGLSLFIHIYDATKAKAIPVALRHARGTVREALCRAGFDTLFQFE